MKTSILVWLLSAIAITASASNGIYISVTSSASVDEAIWHKWHDAKMTAAEFERNVNGATAMREFVHDSLSREYLTGYLRGIRRYYHGDEFGTAKEHAEIMNEKVTFSAWHTGPVGGAGSNLPHFE